jgi:hypothetical protein
MAQFASVSSGANEGSNYHCQTVNLKARTIAS